jgi:hypothetical protein
VPVFSCYFIEESNYLFGYFRAVCIWKLIKPLLCCEVNLNSNLTKP